MFKRFDLIDWCTLVFISSVWMAGMAAVVAAGVYVNLAFLFMLIPFGALGGVAVGVFREMWRRDRA